MPINHWPEGERPREKLLARGAGALSDAELLAIFLRMGTQGKTAVDIGRDLLNEFGDLRTLMNADYAAFSAVRGLGPAKYAQLQAALEIGQRYLAEQMQRQDTLTSPEHTRDYLVARMRDYDYEVFACVFLDSRHRVIAFEELFKGSLAGASVHPREVVKRALAHSAAAVIVAHNHPSGVAEPSHSDEMLTKRLRDALSLVEVRVLDHLVIGDGYAVSFAERGLL